MPHNLDLIVTITGGLTAALVLGFVTQRLKMSPIVGYLLAGVTVGPFTPGFVAHSGLAEQLAELGVILLMFGVGLQFHLEDLLATKKIALPGALVQITVATALGLLVAKAFGWGTMSGVVFGIAISVASTVVLLRVLSDNDALHTPSGHLAVGWLVIEDIFTVLVLVLLPVFVKQSERGDVGGMLLSLGIAVAKIGVMVIGTWFIGKRAIPKLLTYAANTHSRELFTLSVLVLALGIAVGSAKLFGTSMALGAFLAGMIVGQSEFSFRAASEALPMRDAFAVLFFVAVGMLLDPAQLIDNVGLIAATTAVVMIGKSLAAFIVVRVLRRPVKTGLVVAVALAQIGEFSFIVATLGRELKIFPEPAMQALVAAAVISITLNPLLFRFIEPLSRRFSAKGQSQPVAEVETSERPQHRAIVVGYGPVGRMLTRILKDNGIQPTVIELNHETVASLQKEGTTAIYGDASQISILEAAGVLDAESLIFAASGTPPEAVIQSAKATNPRIRIMARCTYVEQIPSSRSVGADVVIAAEAEVALAMAMLLLRSLGATPEQIDRASDRIHSELTFA